MPREAGLRELWEVTLMKKSSSRLPESVSLGAVVMFQVVVRFIQRAFDVADKIQTTCGLAAEANDDIALGVVIGHSQHLAVRLETMRGAFDHFVGRLAPAREQDFDAAGGVGLWCPGRRSAAVEKNRYRRTDGILVTRENVNQFFARRGGMARFAGRQLRPTMQEAVTINQYADERHISIVALRSGNGIHKLTRSPPMLETTPPFCN